MDLRMIVIVVLVAIAGYYIGRNYPLGLPVVG